MNMNEINGLSWGCKNLIKPFSTASQKWFAKKDSSSGKLYRHLHTYMYLLWKEFRKKDIGRTEVKTGSPFLVFTNGDLRWPNKLVLLYKSLPHGSGHLLSDHQFYKVVPYVEKRSSLTNTDTHSRFKKPKLIVTSTPPPSKKATKKKSHKHVQKNRQCHCYIFKYIGMCPPRGWINAVSSKWTPIKRRRQVS